MLGFGQCTGLGSVNHGHCIIKFISMTLVYVITRSKPAVTVMGLGEAHASTHNLIIGAYRYRILT